MGVYDAVRSGRLPDTLRRVSLVELDRGRVQRLRLTVPDLVARIDSITSTSFGDIEITAPRPREQRSSQTSNASTRQSPEPEPGERSHIFVAMPFDPAMDGTFHFGIQQPIRRSGFLPERCDQSVFTGDVLRRIREKIASASLVIADLSEENPNVYLEVGYTWAARSRRC
jgi:hypothetical protein